MSVLYQMNYSVIIKGTRAEFEQIPAVAQQVLEDYKAAVEKARKEGNCFWDSTWNYESLAEELAEVAKAVLETGGEPLLMELESSDGDDTHGDFEDFLTALDENLPGLSIVTYAIWVDVEYGGPDTPSILYSPKGSSVLDVKDVSCFQSRMDTLPDEDWIPYGWRHPDETAPAAKAEGTVTLLGDWSEAEKTIVDKALMGGALETMGYTSFQHAGKAVSRTEEGWEFCVGGAMDAGEAAQNLHLALLPYIKEHEASCAAMCKAMREKKLAIHLYLDESTGPNAAWSYCNNSAWHFLITSDGARLVSKFTWCGTYRFGSRGGAAKCKGVYEQTTGKEWEDLSEGAQFLARQAVSAYKEAHEIDLENDPQYWEAAEWLCQYDIEVEDFLTGNYDEGELCGVDLDELNQLCAGMREIMEKYNSRLGRALKEALKNVPDLTPPARFIPQTFDQRFAGKTFIVKGDLDGYEKGQVKELIEKFGGKVGQRVTDKTAYFVCGSGVGDPFKTALKHGTPLLSADYFEDLTR